MSFREPHQGNGIQDGGSSLLLLFSAGLPIVPSVPVHTRLTQGGLGFDLPQATCSEEFWSQNRLYIFAFGTGKKGHFLKKTSGNTGHVILTGHVCS